MKYLRDKRELAVPAPAIDGRSVLMFLLALALAAMVVAIDDTVGPLAALALPLAIAVLVAALRDYRAATCLTVFLLPVAPTNLMPREMIHMSGANLVIILIMITASSLLLTFALRPRRLAFPRWPRPFFLYLAAFVAAGVHGAFYADEIPDYFVVLHVVDSTSVRSFLQVNLINPAAALGAAAVLAIAIRNATRPTLYLVPIFAAATVFACAVVFFAITSGASLNDLASQESRRYLSGTGLHANELGLLLNTAWALTLFCFLNTRHVGVKVALAVVGGLVLAAVALTFSRGAYLGALAVVGYMLFVQRKFVTCLLTLVVLPVALMLMPQSVTQRATHEVGSNDVDSLSSGRVDEIWAPLLPEIMKSPLVGSGTGSILWSEAARQHKILPVGHPHSAYLGALLDMGVIGTVIVLLFFRHMWRLFRQLAASAPQRLWRGFFNGAAACILLVFVQGLTDDSFLPGRTQAFLWLAYGAAVGFTARLKQRDRARRGPQAATAAALRMGAR